MAQVPEAFRLVFVLLMIFSGLVQARETLPPHVDGELLVQYGAAGITAVKTHFPPGTIVESIAPDVARVILPPGEDLQQAKRRLARDPRIRHVQPNYIKHIQLVPDDRNFDYQWGMYNTGQPVPTPTGLEVVGSAGADIGAVSAWDVTTGSPDVVVALIDTGVELGHRELVGNLWNNPNEARNGLDDDGNGYVDDIHGWDWVGSDAFPSDNEGHGTVLAGIIAARGNNNLQIAGLNWRSSLMVLRTFDSQGISDTHSIVAAIRYAVDHGAQVINASYGAVGDVSPDAPGFDSLEYKAYRDAAERGVLVVAAACNNRSSNDGLRACVPASYDLPNILAVAATDMNDRLADFSNWGPARVDLAAPGVNIVSVAWRNRKPAAYTVVDGTSVASAFVTGAAALLLARARELGLPLSAERLRAIIIDNADFVDSLAGRIANGRRLDVAKALAALEDYARTQTQNAASDSDPGGNNSDAGGGGGAGSVWALLLLGWWLGVRRGPGQCRGR